MEDTIDIAQKIFGILQYLFRLYEYPINVYLHRIKISNFRKDGIYLNLKKSITSVLAVTMIVGALSGPAATFASPSKSSATTVTSTAIASNSKNVTTNFVSSNVSTTTRVVPVLPTVPDLSRGGGVETNNLVSNVIKKAITSAFRYGGSFLGNILSKLSPKAGSFVTKYSGKIADFLDSITNWQENVIASGLIAMGIPPIEAYEIATYLVWLAGI